MKKAPSLSLLMTAATAGSLAAALGFSVLDIFDGIEIKRRKKQRFINLEHKDLGVLKGRDCIYISTVTLDHTNSLTFKGEINGHLASKIRDYKWIPYTLTFKRVIACSSCELDTFLNREYDGCMAFDHGCFTVVQNSRQLAELPIRYDFDRSIYKHFRVFTYDVVFDIFAAGYEFNADMDNIKGFDDGDLGISVEDAEDYDFGIISDTDDWF